MLCVSEPTHVFAFSLQFSKEFGILDSFTGDPTTVLSSTSSQFVPADPVEPVFVPADPGGGRLLPGGPGGACLHPGRPGGGRLQPVLPSGGHGLCITCASLFVFSGKFGDRDLVGQHRDLVGQHHGFVGQRVASCFIIYFLLLSTA